MKVTATTTNANKADKAHCSAEAVRTAAAHGKAIACTKPLGRDAAEVKAALGSEPGPARMLDFMLQTGPFGAAFGANPDGASLALLRANPHGVDFGPLQPRLPEILRTQSGRIELSHPLLVADLDRLWGYASAHDRDSCVLVGRRHVRSNNSWMHNIGVLMKGSMNCSLHVHPIDADRFGLRDGAYATISSRVGTVTAPVEISIPDVSGRPHRAQCYSRKRTDSITPP